MSTYDVRNEVIIDVPPAQVWKALIDEFSGAVGWWRPHNTFVPRSGIRADQAGAVIDVTVHASGADKQGLKLRFAARTSAVDPGKRLVTDYVSGVFRGQATYGLVPLDGGAATKLWMHFAASPAGFLKVLAKVKDIGEQHGKATDEAFAHLAERFERRPAVSAA
jgi:uncharacterized protein YndB with AHSA1/START domain